MNKLYRVHCEGIEYRDAPERVWIRRTSDNAILIELIFNSREDASYSQHPAVGPIIFPEGEGVTVTAGRNVKTTLYYEDGKEVYHGSALVETNRVQ